MFTNGTGLTPGPFFFSWPRGRGLDDRAVGEGEIDERGHDPRASVVNSQGSLSNHRIGDSGSRCLIMKV